MVLPTGADVVQALDRDAQDVARQEDDEATVDRAVGAEAQEEPAAATAEAAAAAAAATAEAPAAAAPTRSLEDAKDGEGGQIRKKTRTEEPAAATAEAADAAAAATAKAGDAAASTRGRMRRQAMKSRIVVQLQVGSEKVVKVRAHPAAPAEAKAERYT